MSVGAVGVLVPRLAWLLRVAADYAQMVFVETHPLAAHGFS